MKQPKKLTRNQKEIVLSHGKNPDKWMLVEETEFYLKLIHKDTQRIERVDNFKRRGK